jgi:hypothetical protein
MPAEPQTAADWWLQALEHNAFRLECKIHLARISI